VLLVRRLLLLLISSSPALHNHRNQPVTTWGMSRALAQVFLTVYDADVRRPSALEDLRRPFGEHLELITTLDASASEQILSTLAAIRALQEHCRLSGAAYKTVVITRYDMRFKTSFGPLLGDVC
jgi:branched-subunit amino acid ABC-type transport system permease component